MSKVYSVPMNENDNLPKLQEYLSVKDAAERLNISEKMVYFYVENKRIKAVRAANIILIPVGEVENFEKKSVGRPRRNTPTWKISVKDNTLFALSIEVRIRRGQEQHFPARLEEIRQSKEFTFAGTVARYIMAKEQKPEQVEIVLIWKKSIMPTEAEREQALEEFRHALTDVFDWRTAQYTYDRVYMHT